MKRYYSLVALASFLAGLIILLLFTEAKAQIDFFTFFIPYDADALGLQFQEGRADFTLIDGDDTDNDAITVTISISVYRDGTVIYYDHWEDGLEQNLTTPTSTSTEIWGDNDPTNGIPPGFSSDQLQAGSVIKLQNTVNLPRDPVSEILFDGGDKLISEGGPLAVTLMVWPITDDIPDIVDPISGQTRPAPGILLADAWELYPTSKWGKEYLIPIGEDLAGQRGGFSVVGLSVQAVLDNTDITIDLNDGSPLINTTLDQGESYTQVNSIRVGAAIRATNPVQVQVFTADPSVNYEARFFTIIPLDQWTNDLLAPRSSDGDFWLYNPNPFAITVTAETTMTIDTIPILPGQTAKYPPVGLSSATGVYFHTPSPDQIFYGVAALDANLEQDWGYALLPKDAASSQTLVGLGIGNNNPTPDGYQSRVYVTALNTTTVTANYPDGTSKSFFVPRLAEVPITRTVSISDPHDLTGTYLFTQDETPFLAVWGQDAGAEVALPSIDAGTTIVPFPSLLIHKTISQIAEEIDCSGTITADDIVEYQLQYFNTSTTQIDKVIVKDSFSTQELDYLPNSTTLNGAVIPDNNTGETFPLANGYTIKDPIEPRGQGVINFQASVQQTNIITNLAVISSADSAARSDVSLIYTVVSKQVDPVYQLKAAPIDPADGIVMSGDTITLGVTITNTDVISITDFPLTYFFDNNLLTFVNAVPAPTITSTGVITWSDITANFGPLLPNVPVNLTLSFMVGQIPEGTTSTVSKVLGKDGNFGDSSHLPTCSNEVPIFFTSVITTPTVTPTPSETPSTTPTSTPDTTPTSTPDTTPTPKNEDDGDNDGDNTPLPPVTAIPRTTPPPAGGTPIAEVNPETNPDSPLPVLLLPETGLKPTTGIFIWTLLALSTLGGVFLWWVHYRRK